MDERKERQEFEKWMSASECPLVEFSLSDAWLAAKRAAYAELEALIVEWDIASDRPSFKCAQQLRSLISGEGGGG